jgi:hypothetical protein
MAKETYILFSHVSHPNSFHKQLGIIYNKGMENPLRRIGAFFILIGCGLFVLFIGSVLGKVTTFIYLILGACAIFLGTSLRKRSISNDEPARFSFIRKVNQRASERRDAHNSKSQEEKKVK